MMGLNICFYGEIWLIIPKLSLLLLLIWSTGITYTNLVSLDLAQYETFCAEVFDIWQGYGMNLHVLSFLDTLD